MTAKTKYEKELMEAIDRAKINFENQQECDSLHDIGMDTGYLMALEYALKKYKECCV